MAIGLIKTVHAAGLQVPDDLSVVGFDGIAYADYCEPTLTTVVQPRRDLGATAAAELIALMTNGKAGPTEGHQASRHADAARQHAPAAEESRPFDPRRAVRLGRLQFS